MKMFLYKVELQICPSLFITVKIGLKKYDFQILSRILNLFPEEVVEKLIKRHLVLVNF